MMGGVLALDLAGNFGFSFWKPGAPRPYWGARELPKPGPKGENLERAFLTLRFWLREFHSVRPVTHIVSEAPWQRYVTESNQRQDKFVLVRFLSGLVNEANTTALELGVPPENISETPHSTMTKHWVGDSYIKSAPGKIASVQAAGFRGWKCETHDSADANGVLCHFLWTHRDRFPPIPFDVAPISKEAFELKVRLGDRVRL